MPHAYHSWVILAGDDGCEEAARRWGVPPLLARLLLNRGLLGDEQATDFLAPPLKKLHQPALLPGATKAACLIVEAVRAKTPIVLYGDYDVDGVTGVSILWHMLRACGAQVSYYLPHRIEEGYGLNPDAVRKLVEDGAGLIVSIDCGITAIAEAAWCRERGIPLVITDHHTQHGEVPDAAAIVHPTVGGTYPNTDLCGAGVAFKVAWAIAQEFCGTTKVAPEFRTLLQHLLSLAALGTIADVVPLLDENRIIVKHGLAGLQDSPLVGVRALIEQAGLAGARIGAYDVGFKLAPRLNAAGRMGHARLAAELLTSAPAERAGEIATYLEDHNRKRQATERRILKEACERVDNDGLASDARRAIVLAGEDWHAGVIGIVASRIVDRYRRPAIMIAMKDGEGQGSGRSIKPFHLHDALTECATHLQGYGGHAMAAGLRIADRKLADFTEAFVSVANNRLTGSDLVSRLRLDAEVALHELTMPTAQAIRCLSPFGLGNPRPRLATDWVDLAAEPRCVGKEGKHLQAAFRQNGSQLKAIGFGLAPAIEDLKQHRRCRLAFEPIINEFNGRRSVELQVLDFEFPGH